MRAKKKTKNKLKDKLKKLTKNKIEEDMVEGMRYNLTNKIWCEMNETYIEKKMRTRKRENGNV